MAGAKRTGSIGRPPTRATGRPAARPPAPPRRSGPWRDRAAQTGWVLLPLRLFVGYVFLYGGISKIADRRFLDGTSPRSMHAAVLAARVNSPISGLLGPVADHSYGFGIVMAAAELAVGMGLLAGLFTRVAAAGGMALALSLWLTVSWNAQPWFTSADLVYLFALAPLAIAGAAGVLSADAWLARAAAAHPGQADDRTRRLLLGAGAALAGAVLLGASALFRRTKTTPAARAVQTKPPSTRLAGVSDVPVGGGVQVTDESTGDPAWVLQLEPGRFTAYDAVCPHAGCTVTFVSANAGFACPCHQSLFDAKGALLSGPAPTGLKPIPVTVAGGEVRTV